MMNWSREELEGMDITKPFYKGLDLNRFLSLYAELIGITDVPDLTFAEKADIVTFTNPDSENAIDHVAIIDKDYPNDVYHRRGNGAPIQNIPIVESTYCSEGTKYGYWKVPDTEYFNGFLDG